MAALIVCGADENGHRDIIAAEPMSEESKDSYGLLFQSLKERGLIAPKLIISDAHSGLVAGCCLLLSGSPFPALHGSAARSISYEVIDSAQSVFRKLCSALKTAWKIR